MERWQNIAKRMYFQSFSFKKWQMTKWNKRFNDFESRNRNWYDSIWIDRKYSDRNLTCLFQKFWIIEKYFTRGKYSNSRKRWHPWIWTEWISIVRNRRIYAWYRSFLAIHANLAVIYGCRSSWTIYKTNKYLNVT
jgi:hypothetical protein